MNDASHTRHYVKSHLRRSGDGGIEVPQSGSSVSISVVRNTDYEDLSQLVYTIIDPDHSKTELSKARFERETQVHTKSILPSKL